MDRWHTNEEFLRVEVERGRTSKDIAKRLKVSYRLIEIYLRKYGIPHVSQIPPQD
jgi:DNA-binding CsgD family transcriptional regulator